MATINIGTEIDLQNLLETRMLIQANSGGGKSVLARVLMEATAGIIPFIIFDRDGEYYTLKEKYGDILVIGGQFADVPISNKSVKLLPREIIGNRLSVIIDLSDLNTTDKRLYVKHFLESMMQLPKEFWTGYLVFIEEAHFFCGQQDIFESGSAVKELMSGGRKKGYCGVLITQRISKLHKDASAEANNKFIGRTFQDVDMDRAARELGFSSAKDRLLLRDLKPGEFYALGTAINPHHPHIVKIKLPETKHPKAGSIANIKPQKPTERLLKLLTKLNDLPGEADKKLKTEQELQKEVNRLRSELQKRSVSANQLPDSDKKLPLLEEKLQKLLLENQQLKRQLSEKESGIKYLTKNVHSYDNLIKKIKTTIEKDTPVIQDFTADVVKDVVPVNKSFVNHNQQFADKVYAKVATNGQAVTGGAMRMLKAAAMFYPNPITKTRMAALARLSHSSGSFSTYKSTLKREELLNEVGGNSFLITEKGLKAAGEVEALPTDPQQLIDLWCEIVGNGSGAARILRLLGNVHPKSMSKEQIGEEIGMAMSGSFSTYLSTLKRNGLIEVNGLTVKAADELFN